MFVGCKCSRLRCEQWLLGVSLSQIKAATVGVGEPLKPPFFPGISELTDFSHGFLDRQLTIGSKLSFVVTSTGRDVEVSSSRLFYPVATPRELPYKVTFGHLPSPKYLCPKQNILYCVLFCLIVTSPTTSIIILSRGESKTRWKTQSTCSFKYRPKRNNQIGLD